MSKKVHQSKLVAKKLKHRVATCQKIMMLARGVPPTEDQPEQPSHCHLQYMYVQRLQKNMLGHIPKCGKRKAKQKETKNTVPYKEGDFFAS